MKMKVYINIFKGLTAPFVLLMMAHYGTWQNKTAWVYLGLHGSYGVLWVLKSRFFPDKSWERGVSWILGSFQIRAGNAVSVGSSVWASGLHLRCIWSLHGCSSREMFSYPDGSWQSASQSTSSGCSYTSPPICRNIQP